MSKGLKSREDVKSRRVTLQCCRSAWYTTPPCSAGCQASTANCHRCADRCSAGHSSLQLRSSYPGVLLTASMRPEAACKMLAGMQHAATAYKNSAHSMRQHSGARFARPWAHNMLHARLSCVACVAHVAASLRCCIVDVDDVDDRRRFTAQTKADLVGHSRAVGVQPGQDSCLSIGCQFTAAHAQADAQELGTHV
jgi:hypothetical protein